METRPPALMAKLVRALIPPASREHVVGDLNERYVAPRQYLFDALRTLPFLIASRLRRTTHPIVLLIASLFLWAAVFYGPQQQTWLVAAIPTLITLVILALRDVYRGTGSPWPREAFRDVGLAALGVVLSQGLFTAFAPQLALTPAALFLGFPLGFTILFLARLQNPSGFHQSPLLPRSLTLPELRTEIDGYQRTVQRAVRVEIGVAIVVAPVFLAFVLWMPGTPVHRIGYGLIAAAALFVAWFLHRNAGMRPIHPDLGFADSVASYRGALERSRKLMRSYGWWYVAPFALGFLVLLVGPRLQDATSFAVLRDTLVIVGIACLFVLITLGVAEKTRRKIEQLDGLTEKPAS